MVLRDSTDALIADSQEVELRMAREHVQDLIDTHAIDNDQHATSQNALAEEASLARKAFGLEQLAALPGPAWLKEYKSVITSGIIDRVSSLGYFLQPNIQVWGMRLWAGTGVPPVDYLGPMPLPLSPRPTFLLFTPPSPKTLLKKLSDQNITSASTSTSLSPSTFSLKPYLMLPTTASLKSYTPLLAQPVLIPLTQPIRRLTQPLSYQSGDRVASAALTVNPVPALSAPVSAQVITLPAPPRAVQNLHTLPVLPTAVQALPDTPHVSGLSDAFLQEAARHGICVSSLKPVALHNQFSVLATLPPPVIDLTPDQFVTPAKGPTAQTVSTLHT